MWERLLFLLATPSGATMQLGIMVLTKKGCVLLLNHPQLARYKFTISLSLPFFHSVVEEQVKINLITSRIPPGAGFLLYSIT